MKFTAVLLPFLVSFAAATSTTTPQAGPCAPGQKEHHDRCVDLRCFDIEYRRFRWGECGFDYNNNGNWGGDRDHDRNDNHWRNGRCDDDYIPHRRHGRTCVWAGCYDRGRRFNDRGDHCCPTDIFN